MSRLIALLTDFGTNDIYVSVMKGVMKSIAPDVEFIDITHAITPQSIQEGALALKNAYHYFPQGTIFLVIVDPGVGSTRRPIVVEAGGYIFVAPDNGVLSYTLAELDILQAFELSNPAYHLQHISNTFHGRDVFAPAAAHLASGNAELSSFGANITDLKLFPKPKLTIIGQSISGEVVHIDHFGNIITSIAPLKWMDAETILLQEKHPIPAKNVTLKITDKTLYWIAHAYHEVAVGEFMAQIDSNGALEIAVNQGNAAQRLGAKIGNPVELHCNIK
jgi:S-adenosyl-L-methionine hydrolase (adenosine-forming)